MNAGHTPPGQRDLDVLVLCLGELLAYDRPNTKPLVVYCEKGTYDPCQLGDEEADQSGLTELTARMRTAFGDTVTWLDVRNTRIAALANRIRPCQASHILVLPAWKFVLPHGERWDGNLDAQDEAVFERLGIRQSSRLRTFAEWLIFSQCLYASRPGSTVSALLRPMHAVDGTFYDGEEFLRPVRASVTRMAAAVDVVRFSGPDSRIKRDAILDLRNPEWALGIVRAVRGTGLKRFRIAEVDKSEDVTERLVALGESGAFGGPTVAGAERQTEWLDASEVDVEEPWEFFRYSPQRQQLLVSASRTGKLIELCDIWTDVGTISEEKYFSDKPVDGSIELPVFTEDDFLAACRGKWDGHFGHAVHWVGPADELPRYRLRIDDLAYPIGGVRTPSQILRIPSQAAGAVADWELIVRRLEPKWSYVAEWLFAFLRSEAGLQWFRISFPPDTLGISDALDSWRIPIPDERMVRAYESALTTEKRLGEALEEIRLERQRLFAVRHDGPGWERLPTFVGKLKVLERAIGRLGDLEGLVRSNFPTPIAAQFAQFVEESGPSKLEVGLRLAENCAAYIGTLCCISLEQSGALGGSDFAISLRNSLPRGMTFGAWLHQLALFKTDSSSNFAGMLRDVLHGSRLRRSLDATREIRNQAAHQLIAPDMVNNTTSEVAKLVMLILADMEPLVVCDLVCVNHALNHPRRQECLEYRARILAGEYGQHVEEHGGVGIHLHPGNCYLRASEREWLLTYPFLTIGQDNALSVLDRYDSGAKRVAVRRLDRTGVYSANDLAADLAPFFG